VRAEQYFEEAKDNFEILDSSKDFSFSLILEKLELTLFRNLMKRIYNLLSKSIVDTKYFKMALNHRTKKAHMISKKQNVFFEI